VARGCVDLASEPPALWVRQRRFAERVGETFLGMVLAYAVGLLLPRAAARPSVFRK
jgi:hypothetical protein